MLESSKLHLFQVPEKAINIACQWIKQALLILLPYTAKIDHFDSVKSSILEHALKMSVGTL